MMFSGLEAYLIMRFMRRPIEIVMDFGVKKIVMFSRGQMKIFHEFGVK